MSVPDLVLSLITDVTNTAEAHAINFSAWFDALPPEQQASVIFIGVFGLPALEAALFTAKTIATRVLRFWGLSHPAHYRWWPRVLPWRLFYRIKMMWDRWIEFVFRARSYSTGGFSSAFATMTQMYKPGQIMLGLPWIWGFKIFQPIGLTIKTHLMVLAQSGAGKSIWLLVTLALWKGSALIIDPKGELWRRLIYKLSKKKQVVVLSPYNPDRSGQINPFDCLHLAFLRNGESDAIRWAYRIGQAFIETPPGSKQPFFTDAARGYMVGLILFVYVSFPEGERNLGTVRDLNIHGLRVYNDDGSLESTAKESKKLLHKLMMECEAFSGAIAGAAAPFINASAETAGNLQATLQERTKILDIPSVRFLLSDTTRPLHELKTCNDYVLFFDAPVTSIREELKDLVRLLTNMVIYTFESVPKKKGQCLFVIEELNAQGYNGCIEVALPVARSFGLNIIVIVQDVQGLKAAYTQTHLAFIGNADATVWLSSSHPYNLKQLSELLGKTTIIEKDKKTGKKHHREINVMEPEQIGRFLSSDSGNMIVTRAGKRPLRLRLDPYFKALPVTAYAPDPDHKETWGRRFIRFFLNPRSKS